MQRNFFLQENKNRNKGSRESDRIKGHNLKGMREQQGKGDVKQDPLHAPEFKS